MVVAVLVVFVLMLVVLLGAVLVYSRYPTSKRDYHVTVERKSKNGYFANGEYMSVRIEPKRTVLNNLRSALDGRDREYVVMLRFPPNRLTASSVMFSASGSTPHQVMFPDKGVTRIKLVLRSSEKMLNKQFLMTPYIRGLRVVSISERDPTNAVPSAKEYVHELRAYKYFRRARGNARVRFAEEESRV